MTASLPSSPRRLPAVALLALLLLGAAVLPAPTAAAAPAGTESTTVRLAAGRLTHSEKNVAAAINRARAARGKRTLPTNALMNRRAQKWAEHLRAIQNCGDSSCLVHRPAPFGTPAGWCGAAENIGRSGNGLSLATMHASFMGSSGHRTNILNSRWTHMGVGVARDAEGEYFVVHAFADFTC